LHKCKYFYNIVLFQKTKPRKIQCRMRETSFIEQNTDKWRDFEKILRDGHGDPDRVGELFVQINDDLSYSRTFYPNRSVRVYLNGLAQRVFLLVYRGQKPRITRIGLFWKEELPILLYTARRDMAIAFLTFLGAFLVGVLSCAMDPSFAEQILGQDYVEMTQRFIESGDPMAVYKQSGPWGMSLGIAFNNLYVASLSFVLGIFYAIGSLFILVSNGVMVGVFQYFFIQQGLFLESFLTIWIHGTLEISAIVLAAGAGITMGRGLAFPGTFSRWQSFQQSARRGFKIVLGIAPLIVLAAIFEGFLTRHTDTGILIRALFILACLAFVLVYFVWYPRRVAARTSTITAPPELLPDRYEVPSLDRIRGIGELFTDLFFFLNRGWGTLVPAVALAALAFCTPLVVLGLEGEELFFQKNTLLGSLQSLLFFYDHPRAGWAHWMNIPILAAFSAMVFPRLMGKPFPGLRPYLLAFLRSLLPASLLVLWVHYAGGWFLLAFPLLPIPMLWLAVLSLEPETRFALPVAVKLFLGDATRSIQMAFLLVLVGGLFFSLLGATLFWQFFNLLGWVVRLSEPQAAQVGAVGLMYLTYAFQYAWIALFASGFGLLYYSLLEITEARGLHKQVMAIGTRRQIRGIEQETP
jgi:uncharacterized membrane protein SpoIIM required for sporulation